VPDLPEFKSEKEEAEFWDANPDLITAAIAGGQRRASKER
jgi:hypothetical protein